ncbi:hypothetical protein [Simkania sp.]|uniref:hypothetical protein n=1 Tax=Simkania sp. TaxID=34094 RepID=UPI003B51D767
MASEGEALALIRTERRDLTEESTLLNDIVAEGSTSTECSGWNILFATSGIILTVSLIAVRTILTFSNPINTLMMGAAGVCCQFAFQNIKPIANVESHIISDYGADIFLSLTQIILNIPENPIDEGIINGVLYGLFGTHVVRVITTLSQLTLDQDRTSSYFVESTRFVKVLFGNTGVERIIGDMAKAIIAGALLTCGYVFAPNWFILAKVGYLFLGNAIGGLAYELVHMLRLYFEYKYPLHEHVLDDPRPLSERMHHSVYIMRMTEKVLHVFSIALPGLLLGVNSSPTDFFAGALTGIQRQIDIIRFTTTPIVNMSELERDPNAPENTLVRIKNAFYSCINGTCPQNLMMTFVDIFKYLFGIAGVGGFIIWNMAIGTTDDQITLACFGAMLYGSYSLSRLINKVTIDEKTSRLAASAFFYTNYSLLPPLLYVAIDQWMNIGDIALNTYGVAKVAFDVIAWVSLAWALGTLASERGSRRKRPYPAHVPAVALLLTGNWWFQNFLPLIGIHPSGD